MALWHARVTPRSAGQHHLGTFRDWTGLLYLLYLWLAFGWHPLLEHHPEVVFIDDNQVVEALVLQGPDDSLGDRIGTGRSHRAEQGLYAQAPGPPGEVTVIDAIPVAQ